METPMLKATLLPHQQDAREWCLQKEKDGCILADDMGLGKTVTSCSLLVSNVVKTLVIVPLALLTQWATEIEKHTKGLSTVIYHGGKRNTVDISGYDVTITTAHTIVGDFRKGIIAMYATYDRLIIDEAHKLKNSKSKFHMILSSIFQRTPYKVLLTGTPICNNINDLISLFLLLNTYPYNSNDYWKRRSLKDKVEMVQDIKSQFLLYRTKDVVLQGKLPDITMKSVRLPLVKKTQKAAYKVVKESLYDCKLIKILRMRQCVNDIGMIDSVHDISEKVEQVINILETIPLGDKVVIFSQWKTMLDIVAMFIDKPYLMYTGQSSSEEKKTILEEFNDPNNTTRRLMFITLKCGGCGLNLNIANHAIMIEPYFNHADERQAIDRIYRLGQQKKVFVYKLRISSSIENWMRQLQKTKFSLSNIVLQNTGTTEDILEHVVTTRKVFDYYVNNIGEERDLPDI